MKTKTNTAAALTIGLILAANTQAAIVDRGSYLTDTASGLEWLDVTESINMSRNQVSSELAAGGKFFGWRYATGAEFLQLASNATGQYMTNPTTYYGLPINITLDSLVAMLGSTLDAYYLHFYGKTFNDYLGNPAYSQHYTLGLLADEIPNQTSAAYFGGYLNEFNRNGYSQDELQAHFVGFGAEFQGYNVGSFLVRTTNAIPEPETLLLIGLGLGGIFAVSRKKANVTEIMFRPVTTKE